MQAKASAAMQYAFIQVLTTCVHDLHTYGFDAGCTVLAPVRTASKLFLHSCRAFGASGRMAVQLAPGSEALLMEDMLTGSDRCCIVADRFKADDTFCRFPLARLWTCR